ncbi:MAG: flagellar basal body rod protein FlgB [Candidatus Delongbacteria bacterium]|nr:flagellar basal body rod protein FlgB [Candidatus Delongbacteria bacterium]
MVSKNRIDETILPLLNRSMDAYTLRQKAIANNVANAETPGYRRLEVDFEEHLQKMIQQRHQVLERTDRRHLPDPHAVEFMPVVMRQAAVNDPESNGVNSVDIDQEMASLAKALLGFRFASRVTANEFELLRKAISGNSY